MSGSSVPDSHAAARARDLRRGASAGVIAAILTLATMIVFRAQTGRTSAIDASAELTLDLLPLRLFSALIDLFGTAAKAWLLAGILGFYILVGALIGRWVANATAGSRRIRWERGFAAAIAAGIALAILLLIVYGNETGGPLAGTGAFWTFLWLAVAMAVFGLSLPLALALLRRTDPPPGASEHEPADLAVSRRRLITQGGLGVAALTGLAVLGRELRRVRSGEVVAERDAGKPIEPITPNDEFYVVSKNFRDPAVDGDTAWTISLDGLVDHPLELNRAALEAIAASDFVSTLTCISNEIGGPLISTARWTGAPLQAILNRAGIQSGAVDVVFHGRDGYADSIPVTKAMAPETAVVWGMNGVDLPKEHGFPVRVIVPGLYGIKNVKWLERIEVVGDDFKGYWQKRGWTDSAVIKTSSQIDSPRDRGVVEAAHAELAGLAFAGTRGISRVEVSTDGGDTWQNATLTVIPSPYSWALWSLPWTPTSGTHKLSVRATDGTGALQTSDHEPPLPDGASGWHSITVGIVE